MTELELIERASAIQTKLEMLKQNKNKWKNPERLEKTLMILLHTVEQAIEGELALIRRIQRRIVPKHKELAYDELGNVFEIEGILWRDLDFRWNIFDDNYSGSMKMHYYIEALNKYLQFNCSIKSARVKFVKHDINLVTNTNMLCKKSK